METGCTEIGSKEAVTLLRGLRDVHILIHRSPDGDCIGGGYALYYILRDMGIRSRVICADTIPANLQTVTSGIAFEEFSPQVRISVDVSDRKLFGNMAPEDANAEIALCIDHHISNTHYAEKLHWNPDASAACEVIFYMMQEQGLPVTREIAQCLYIGMATDTGCFRFANAGAKTFAAVAEIKRLYPDIPYSALNRALFIQKTRGRLALEAKLMQNTRLSDDGRVALNYLPYAWMQELGVSEDETDGIANLCMQILGVEIGITCRQTSDGSYRVSMRAGETADVSKVCAQFGGGGHVKASGCSFESGDAEEICAALMKAAEDSL